MDSFLGELKRRNVIKVALAYGIVAWLLVQVSATTFPILQIPHWAVALVTMLALLGFPVVLIVAWVFELTPQGLKRTEAVPHAQSIAHVTGRRLDFAIIGLLAALLAFVAVEHYVLEPAPTADAALSMPAAPPPAVAAAEERAPLPSSVAVLPFENLSPDADNAYFAAGIHEELLNQLAKLRNLSVISRTSVLRYADSTLSIPEIAKELNVGTVMEGSIRYANGRVRITTQLIDAHTDNHLWSETYDRDFSDVFSVESDIAMNIANALQAEFSPAEQASIEAVPTNSSPAYALYLRALSLPSGGATARLIVQYLDAAIALDPQFAQAYARRAWQYALPLLNSVNVPVEDYERHAVADAEQALALDPSIGLAHSVLAGLAELHWRWAEARRGAELAYQQSPNDLDVLYQYMRLMRSAGNYDEAIRANERLIQLEPTTANFHTQLAIAYRYARQYEAAVAAVKRGIALNPAAGGPHVHLAYAEAALGQREEAVSELQLAEQLFAGNFGQIFRVSQMAMAYSLVGRREDAQRMFDLLGDLDRQSPVGEAVWAQAHLALGQYDEAYEQLVAAMAHPSQANYTTLIEIKANPWSLPELDAPRFREVFRGFWSTQ